MLPTQRSLDKGRDARSKFLALALYMDTHGGKLPPDPSNPPSIIDQANEIRYHYISNKYHSYADLTKRIQRVKADLYLGNGARDPKVQKDAGGSDRLPTDHGGHIIARQFNGPRYFFNHFAQDRSFNKKAYAKLEYRWRKIKETNGRVVLDIRLFYPGLSRRPSRIFVEYWVNGARFERDFPNSPEANSK
jgi:hypothetical protein